jgi:hypothetical protein
LSAEVEELRSDAVKHLQLAKENYEPYQWPGLYLVVSIASLS